VLSGSIFGDHCSTISDTTIMSAMASGSDHMDHVKTQIPYAVTAAVVGVLACLFVGIGLPVIIALLLGGVGFSAVARFGEKKSE
jgi:Na+/H+ antiporter NhaC